MATEALYIPEEFLAEFLRVLRVGIAGVPDIPDELRRGLEVWCAEEDAYLHDSADEDGGSDGPATEAGG